MNYNEKTMRRIVRCKKCQIDISTILPANYRCTKCNSMMVTVVNSIITGERITGAIDNVNYEQFKEDND